MIYLMNSAVMPAGSFGTYRYRSATLDDLRAVVRGQRGPWQSALGYPQNCDLIERWTGVRPALARLITTLATGDRALVMRLRHRIMDPRTKGAAVSDLPDDWELAWIDYEAAP